MKNPGQFTITRLSWKVTLTGSDTSGKLTRVNPGSLSRNMISNAAYRELMLYSHIVIKLKFERQGDTFPLITNMELVSIPNQVENQENRRPRAGTYTRPLNIEKISHLCFHSNISYQTVAIIEIIPGSDTWTQLANCLNIATGLKLYSSGRHCQLWFQGSEHFVSIFQLLKYLRKFFGFHMIAKKDKRFNLLYLRLQDAYDHHLVLALRNQ